LNSEWSGANSLAASSLPAPVIAEILT
jgi:hypothetical protein